MAVEFLHELNVPFFKVGSGDTNNFPYLVKTAKKGENEMASVEKWKTSSKRVALRNLYLFKLY